MKSGKNQDTSIQAVEIVFMILAGCGAGGMIIAMVYMI